MRSLCATALFTMAACVAPPAPTTAPIPHRASARPQLAVATFNVNFAIPDDASTVRAAQSLDADVLLLQETNPAWERALAPWVAARRLHARYWHSERWPAGGAAVISRWPLRGVRSVDSAVGWFQAHRFMIEHPCGPIEAVNVHLQPPITEGSPARGWFDAPAQHEREIAAIFDALVTREGRALIVAGDFNEPEDRGAVRWLARTQRLSSALPGFEPDATTWRWDVGPIELTHRLDHIVFSPRSLAPIDARVIARGRSDHVPVRAVFALRAGCAR